MKNLKLLCILVFGILCLQSCSDDDEINQANIIGVWRVNNVDIDLTVNDIDVFEYLTEVAGYSTQEATLLESLYSSLIEASLSDLTVEFKADNTYEAKLPNENPDTGTWVVNSNGTVLTLDEGTNEESVFTINSLTSNALNLSVEQNEAEDLNEDGTNETLVANVSLSLTK